MLANVALAQPATRPAGAAERRALPVQQFSGDLVEIAADHAIVRVAVDPGRVNSDTLDQRIDFPDGVTVRVSVDHAEATLADLKPGLRVNIIQMQAPRPSVTVLAQTPSIGGELVKIDGRTLTIKRGDDLVVTANDATRVIVFGPRPGQPRVRAAQTATLANLKVGMFVSIHPPQGVPTLIEGRVLSELAASQPATDRVAAFDTNVGVVLRVEADAVVVATNFKGEQTYRPGPNDTIRRDGKAATLADLMPEDDIVVSVRTSPPRRPGGPTMTIRATTPPFSGLIKAVDGDTLTITRRFRNKPPVDETVRLPAGLTIEVLTADAMDAKPGTRADLRVGDEVQLLKHNDEYSRVRVYRTPAK